MVLRNMVLVLPESAVQDCLDLDGLVDVVEDALVRQARGDVERPDRPHYPVGQQLDGDAPLGTGIAMPAYLYGDDLYATKLVGVHEGNADRGLPTIHAQIVLTNARTGVPEAFVGGTTITNARTGCIGAVSVRALAPDSSTLSVFGAGAQARWQTRAIATVAPLEDVRIYSPSDSRKRCAADLRDRDIAARAVDTPAAAVEDADTVVTATTATEPVFPADALAGGALVVAIGAFTAEMQELAPEVLRRAEAVFADVPDEVAETGDVLATDITAEDLVPLGQLLDASGIRGQQNGGHVVLSVGSATLDAAASTTVYRRAREIDAGTEIPL
jgi:alanine dehydrogenase